MRNLACVAGIAFLVIQAGVAGQTPDWRPGNRSLTSAEEREAAAKAKTLPFKPRDLSGVWGLGTNGFDLDQRAVPGRTSCVRSYPVDSTTRVSPSQNGHPHSAAMRLVERYRRAAADTMAVTITLTDPETYTQSWVTKTTLRLNPVAEIGEYFCVPSDEEVFRQKMREPAGGAGRR